MTPEKPLHSTACAFRPDIRALSSKSKDHSAKESVFALKSCHLCGNYDEYWDDEIQLRD